MAGNTVNTDQTQGGIAANPAPALGRYNQQVDPNGTETPATARGIQFSTAMGQAASGVGEDIGRVAADRLAAEQRLWLVQQSTADDLAAQKMEIDSRNAMTPGGTTFQGVSDGWKTYTQSRLDAVKDPVLKSIYAQSLVQTQKSLLSSAQSYDAAEQGRYAYSNFQQAVENKAKFYNGLGYDQIDHRVENDLGEMGSIINQTAADPETRQKMRDYMMKIIPDAANERKITVDPQGFLAQQSPARPADIRIGDQNLPRGLRNNNPGNLTGTDSWQGKTGADAGGYLQFDTPENGLRAMAVNLVNQQDQHGLNTVAQIVGKYAPPAENDTPSYIASVSKSMGVQPDQPLDLKDPQVLGSMMQAMVQHENGTQPYSARSILWAAHSAAQPDLAGPMPSTTRGDGGVMTGSTAWNMGTYEQQQEWMTKAESKIREVSAERSRIMTQGNELMKTVEDRMNEGLSVPDNEVQQIGQYVTSSGVPELINKWTMMQGQAQAQQGMMRMNPVDLRNYIDTVLSPAAQKNGATQYEGEVLKTAHKTLDAMDNAVKTDPLGWYQRIGGEVPVLDFNDPAAMQTRRAVANGISGLYKVPVENALFTPQESTELVNQLKAATPQQQLMTAENFAKGFGPDANHAAQIFKKEIPVMGAAIGMISSKSAGQSDYQAASTMLQGVKAESAISPEAMRAAVNAQIKGAVYDPETEKMMQEAIFAYYKGLSLQAGDPGKEINPSRLQTSIEGVAGQPVSIAPKLFGQTSHIFSYKGDDGQFVSPGHLETLFAGMSDDVLKKTNGGLPQALDHSDVPLDKMLRHGRFMNVGDGLYGVMMNEPPGFLIGKDGRPYVIDARRVEAEVGGKK